MRRAACSYCPCVAADEAENFAARPAGPRSRAIFTSGGEPFSILGDGQSQNATIKLMNDFPMGTLRCRQRRAVPNCNATIVSSREEKVPVGAELGAPNRILEFP